MIHLSQPGIPVVVPELPASCGLFYQAGEGNPHSPLRKTSMLNGKCCFCRVSIEFNDLSYSSRVPPGTPPINEAEIGGKFLSLSNAVLDPREAESS